MKYDFSIYIEINKLGKVIFYFKWEAIIFLQCFESLLLSTGNVWGKKKVAIFHLNMFSIKHQ